MADNLAVLIASDSYLKNVIAGYQIPGGLLSPSFLVQLEVEPILRSWANSCLRSIDQSGSLAKGTAIRGQSDVDLFVSLHSWTNGTLGEIYDSLFQFLKSKALNPQRRNVAIQFTCKGHPVDVTPGRLQADSSGYHSLFRHRVQTWCQTNIAEQIRVIRQSNCLDEIRLTKIWRNNHNLDFPSFYLELSVIRALEDGKAWSLAQNFVTVLRYLSVRLEGNVILDPTNSGNKISEDLFQYEKLKIAACAETSLRKNSFAEVIW